MPGQDFPEAAPNFLPPVPHKAPTKSRFSVPPCIASHVSWALVRQTKARTLFFLFPACRALASSIRPQESQALKFICPPPPLVFSRCFFFPNRFQILAGNRVAAPSKISQKAGPVLGISNPENKAAEFFQPNVRGKNRKKKRKELPELQIPPVPAPHSPQESPFLFLEMN